MSTDIDSRLTQVLERIRAAEQRYNRAPGSVRLLAVSKRQSAAAIAAAAQCGQCAFGENYPQEGLEKMTALADPQLEWHLIGPLQSNKTKAVAAHFDWVHSLDRLKIARRLAEQRPDDMPPLNACLQVNVSGEDTKSGIAPLELEALAKAVAELPRLKLRGLMAIPAPAETLAAQRKPFAELRRLFEALRNRGLPELDTLSMGMSADLEAAVAEGATMVRVGTAVFGPRD